MAELIDSSIFIAAERRQIPYDRVTAVLGGEDLSLAAITVSELLAGVHLADTEERRLARATYVERIVGVLPVVPFDLATARVYARIGTDARRAGFTIGAHDLQIAATALSSGYGVVTYNLRDFRRVPGLRVRTVGKIDGSVVEPGPNL